MTAPSLPSMREAELQAGVIDDLAVAGVPAFVWWPADYPDRIAEILR